MLLYQDVVTVRNEVKKSRLKLCVCGVMKPVCGLITFQCECLNESGHSEVFCSVLFLFVSVLMMGHFTTRVSFVIRPEC